MLCALRLYILWPLRPAAREYMCLAWVPLLFCYSDTFRARAYDAKEGFGAGGSSIHNCMSAHGPDEKTFAKASSAELAPQYYDGTLAFMFESRHVWQPSEAAMGVPWRHGDYQNCWAGLSKNFPGGE